METSKRVTATVKMTYTDDTDLIAWWNSIPRGSRNAVMKDVIRDYIGRNRGGFRPVMPRNVPQPFDPVRFIQVSEDAAWIRAALNDLPRYLEQVMHYVAVHGAGPAGGGVAQNNRGPTGTVDDAEASRRAEKVRKAKW
ncbi:MAG: hypothetical protein IPK19_37830 [Chloroflexi bacterium]|nr:hypothetical protein [Chloroflexota bacterium]